MRSQFDVITTIGLGLLENVAKERRCFCDMQSVTRKRGVCYGGCVYLSVTLGNCVKTTRVLSKCFHRQLVTPSKLLFPMRFLIFCILLRIKFIISVKFGPDRSHQQNVRIRMVHHGV